MRWIFVVHKQKQPSYELLSWHNAKPHRELVMPRPETTSKSKAIFIRLPWLHFLLAPQAPEVAVATTYAVQHLFRGPSQ